VPAEAAYSTFTPVQKFAHGSIHPLPNFAAASHSRLPIAASQRLLPVDRDCRVHGVGHIAIIEARGYVPRG